MITISPTYLFISTKIFFCDKKTPPDHYSQLGLEGFSEWLLSNIMKYGKNDIEWQTSIQGMSLSDFGII